MSLEDNCGKFGRTKMIFFVTLPGGLVLCVPGQYRVFPPLAAIIAASRWGILPTRRWRRCTGICAHLSSRAWRSSSRFWGGLSIELIARPNSSQRCSMGLRRANSLAKFKRASSSARRATRDTTVSTFIIGGRLGITVHCICFSGFKSDWLLFTVTGST